MSDTAVCAEVLGDVSASCLGIYAETNIYLLQVLRTSWNIVLCHWPKTQSAEGIEKIVPTMQLLVQVNCISIYLHQQSVVAISYMLDALMVRP